MQTFFLDTETTGLHPPHDKLVEVAIVNEAGDIVLDTLVNPERPIGFATEIHGISDEMVENAPTLENLWPQIFEIIENNHVIIYNAQFDTKFFPDALNLLKILREIIGIYIIQEVCLMKDQISGMKQKKIFFFR